MFDRTAVSEIMTRAVLTTTPDARLSEAAHQLREGHVSGLPVLGPDGEVVGVLSETDLVRGLHESTGVGSPRGILDLVLESAPAGGESLLEQCRRRMKRARVSELMTRSPVTVRESTSLREAAQLMRTKGVNRLPVVDAERRLVGIVTRGDVVAALSGSPSLARGALHPSPVVAPPRVRADPYADA